MKLKYRIKKQRMGLYQVRYTKRENSSVSGSSKDTRTSTFPRSENNGDYHLDLDGTSLANPNCQQLEVETERKRQEDLMRFLAVRPEKEKAFILQFLTGKTTTTNAQIHSEGERQPFIQGGTEEGESAV